MGLLLVVLPRRYALVPVIILTCFMTMGQAVLVLGLHFTMIRILALFGWTRLIVRGEIRFLKLNGVDKAVIWWTLSSVIMNTLLWHTADAFVNRLGLAYNAIGMYFLFRFLLCDLEDIKRVFAVTAVLIMPLAAAMVIEYVTGRNVFAAFGVLHETVQMRDGALRCEGPFAHPILAGTFAATQIPFFVALWQQGAGKRLLAGLAIVASAVIIFTTGSSGPYLTGLIAVGGLCLWPWRKHMRRLRWGFVATATCLHLVMKAPVWFLLARVDVVSGSTGFHRAYLIDRALATLSQWWLVGMQSTESFGEQIHGDITNEYIWQGINGGLLTMALFVLIIVSCFQTIGRSLASGRARLAEQRCVWAMGAALFAHVITYFSIQYFDQNFVNWNLLLAMIGTIATGHAVFQRGRTLSHLHVAGPAGVESEMCVRS